MNIWHSNKRAFLFDMDGVLIDNTTFHVRSWLEFAHLRGGQVTEEQVVDWMGSPGRDYVRRMFKGSLTDADADALLKEKEALYREIYRPHLALREGLSEFLERAKKAGILCTITTGGSRDNVDFVLDGLGIRPYFAALLDASQYFRGKPWPDGYLQTAALVGVSPKDCIVFEDALNGIAAAQAAHIPVVAITGTNTRETLEAVHPDQIIDSFRELL